MCLPARVRAIAIVSALAAPLFHAATVHAESDLLGRPAIVSARAQTSMMLALARAGKRLVAVGERGIILLSDDNGRTWRQAKSPVSVSLTNVRFASSRDGWAVGHSAVVLHSGDGGETWVKQLDGKQAARIALEAAKADQSVARQRLLQDAERMVAEGPDKPFLDICVLDAHSALIVGAYGLIFATQDGGHSWHSLQQAIDNPKGKHLYSIQAAGSDVVIAGEQGALFRSSDRGATFAEVRSPYAGTFFGVITLPPKQLVAFGLRGNVYRTDDGGASWQKIETGGQHTLTAGLRLTDGPLVIADDAGRVLQSHDSGRTFRPLDLPQATPVTAAAEADDGSLILAGVRGITRVARSSVMESRP